MCFTGVHLENWNSLLLLSVNGRLKKKTQIRAAKDFLLSIPAGTLVLGHFGDWYH